MASHYARGARGGGYGPGGARRAPYGAHSVEFGQLAPSSGQGQRGGAGVRFAGGASGGGDGSRLGAIGVAQHATTGGPPTTASSQGHRKAFNFNKILDLFSSRHARHMYERHIDALQRMVLFHRAERGFLCGRYWVTGHNVRFC